MKTVLLGMNNPQSSDPRHVLYPHPPGCAGHRLWTMLNTFALALEPPISVTKLEYLRGFERINILDSAVWSASAARERVDMILERIRGRRVIMCGVTVPKIVGVHFEQWCEWDEAMSLIAPVFEFCVIPHPSGRCREYNDSGMRSCVGDLLLEEYRRGQLELTTGV